MKWTFHPTTKQLTTSLPLSVEVEDARGKPSISLSQVGELELKPFKNGFKADFYVKLPGTYYLTIKDKYESSTMTLIVEEHTYLDFQNEFGSFFILFVAVMGGIVLWTRKIMKKKTA